MLRPPRPATAVVVAALVVLAGVAPAIAATDATATDHASDGDSLDAATPSAENATVDAWRVPGYVDAANASASELASYHEPGVRTNVTSDDYLAVAVDSPDLDAAVADRSGNVTERVLAALTDSGRLTLVQTVETTPVSLQPGVLWLNASNTRAVDGSTADRYVLVVDVDETIGIRDGHLLDGDRSFAGAYEDHVGTSNVLGFFEESWTEETRTFAANYRERSDDPVVAESRPVAFVYPSNESATVDTWRVPESVDVANASESEVASFRNPTAEATNVTARDRLVVDVTVPGLDARVANASGNASANLTARVLAALNESGHFAVRQTTDTTTPERQSRSLWLNATNVDARDVAGDDRYRLVVDPSKVLAVHASPFDDPSAVAAEYRDDDEDYRFDGLFEDGLDAYEVYTARYYANDSVSGLAATSRRVKFRPAAAFVATTGPLEPGANVTVAGTTTVAPGTELAVTARTDAGVVATAVATVDDRGRYDATLDLAGVDAPTTVNVTVALAANRSRTLTRAPATLAVRERRAVIEFDDQTTSTGYVSARANLSHGGVLVLRNDTGVVDQTTVLDAGVDQTVTFSLPAAAANGTYRVVAYRVRDDGTHGERYPNGSASATITFEAETTTTPPTTNTTTPPTTTYNETPILGDDTETTATRTSGRPTVDPTTPVAEDPIPGFGAGVAAAALLAVVLVGASRRRRDS
ncbi:BGTF surface domain-containing protein [Halorubellus litoreus]|uniref:BGTF surface domain-containing protein n=1 Tax=Halorubellus litoreus TaxID=755308 RepID=A0ABD5VAR0_9EURY